MCKKCTYSESAIDNGDITMYIFFTLLIMNSVTLFLPHKTVLKAAEVSFTNSTIMSAIKPAAEV